MKYFLQGRKSEKSILFITSHRLGDAVLSSAALARLVEVWPEARFTIVCGPEVADLFRALPQCAQIIPLRKSSWNRHWFVLWWQTIGRCWFLVVDLRSSPLSLFLWAKRRVIVKGGRRAGHKIAQHQRSLLKKLPVLQKEGQGADTLWQPRLWSVPEANNLLPLSARPYIALAPTAGSEDKIWPVESFLSLAEFLRHKGYNIVFLYGTGARESRLMDAFRPALAHYESYYDYGGREQLSEVISIIKQCVLLVGNDSGLMHLAAASGIACLGLFGPTRSEEYAPVGSRASVVSVEQKEGGEGEIKNAMNLLKSDRVYAEIIKILEKIS